MNNRLNESFVWCRQLTRQTAGNFGYAFHTLPRDRYLAMCALYAYMRVTDDLADDERLDLPDRRRQLENWRTDVKNSLAGHPPSHPALPALADIVNRYAIPADSLLTVIDGVEFDLSPRTIATFDELSSYCHQVAGVVGVCCLHIWGYREPRALVLADRCGRALQLTNILRDLAEDARQGRFYIPEQDFIECGYTREELAAGREGPGFQLLMERMSSRALADYDAAEELFVVVDQPGRPILRAMIDIYWELFLKLRATHFSLSQGRVRLSKARKCWLATRAWLRPVRREIAAPLAKTSAFAVR
jgi:phytoene synthase